MWTNVIVIAVVALLSPAMTQVPEEDQAALDKVKTCMSTGFSASVDEVAKEAAVGPIAKFPILCSFWKAFDSCLAQPLIPTPRSSTYVLDFFRAFEYQHAILSKRSGVCPKLDFTALEKLVFDSGIMQRMKLSDIVEDPYEKCVGDAHKTCIAKLSFAIKVDVHLFFSNVNCYKDAGRTCFSLMLQHFNTFMETFKQNMQQRHII